MKKTGILCKIFCLTLSILLLSMPVMAVDVADYDLPVTQGCHSIDAQVPMIGASKDIENVQSAFLYDYDTQTLVYSVNPDTMCDPGSLVKIMTGFIVAEQGNLDDIVTVSGEILDLLPEGSYVLDLQDGEKISLRDLLYCILVDSANDAAIIAANHISGSVEAFVQEMNRYATEFGCSNTTFTNVHGIYDPFQTTTARDIAKILVMATENEAFMDAFSSVYYTVPATNKSDERELATNNFLMNDDMMSIYLDERVTGGRAATMESGERNLAVTAEQDDVRLVSVVIGSESVLAEDGYSTVTFGSFTETSALLNLGFKGHYSCQIFYENQILKQFEVQNGDSYLTVGIKDPVRALLPSGVTYSDLSYRFDDSATQIQAPVKAGEKITTVQVWYNDLCLAVTDLFAMHDVSVKTYVPAEEIPEETATGVPSAVIIIFSIILLLVVLLFGRRFIFRIIRKRRIKNSKRIRRRNR